MMRVTQVVKNAVQTWSTMRVIPRVENPDCGNSSNGVEDNGVVPLRGLQSVMGDLCWNATRMFCQVVVKTVLV